MPHEWSQCAMGGFNDPGMVSMYQGWVQCTRDGFFVSSMTLMNQGWSQYITDGVDAPWMVSMYMHILYSHFIFDLFMEGSPSTEFVFQGALQ